MTTLDAQAELPLARPAQRCSIPIELVRQQRTAAAAFTLACSVSGLEDKEIYMAIGVDAGYFSNIKKGKATLQADLMAPFCRVVGNTIFLEWQAFQLGCTLVMIKSEAARLLDEERTRREAMEAENRLMRELLQGRAAP
jgi:hypothetical protein